MKNIQYIITIVCVIIITSCGESFLNIPPKSEGTADITYKTDKDFNDAIIGSYRKFQDIYDRFWVFSELPGEDVLHLALRDQAIVRIDNFAVDANDGLMLDVWRDNYQLIERVNTALSKIDEVEASTIPNKDQYVGEAKFIRALSYFNLVRVFGDIPLPISPLSIEESLKSPRVSTATVYKLIVSDLRDASSKLPATYLSNNVGRATKGAALSLLGKVYLTTHDFVNAESSLKEITTLGYKLLDNFENLFDFNKEHHSEYIFDIEYISGNIGLGSMYTRDFIPDNQDIGAMRKVIIGALSIVENPEAGGRCTPSLNFIDLFEAGDLRQYRTATKGVYTPNGYKQEGIFKEIPQSAVMPAITLKYATPMPTTDGYVNWRITRYADVLLMLAEAMNENGKTAEALTYLNQVRIRAGLSGYSGLSQLEARNKIYLERRLELFMESCGERWFDLLRTGRALEVCGPLGMHSHEKVFPIPQTQIEIVNDKSILWQNNGY